MRIAFIGAGAVGGWFGGRLALSGTDVCFIARGETLTRLRTVGLELIDADGHVDVVVPDLVPAAETFEELRAQVGHIDLCIVTTKAFPGSDPFPEVPADIPLVTTQNSVEIPHLAAERQGADNVLPGIVRGFFIHTGPAQVQFRPGPQSLNVGRFVPKDSSAPAFELGTRYASGADSVCSDVSHSESDSSTCNVSDSHDQLVHELMQALHAAGIDGEFLPNIWVDIWTKAMFVANFGALGALANQPIGYLREKMRSSLRAMIEEAEAAARALDVPLPEDIVEQTLAFVDAQGADNTSSMQRDFTAGQVNELDAQIGAMRRMAARAGVTTPLMDLVQGALEGRAAASASE